MSSKPTLLSDVGRDLVAVLAPVSLTMLLVVLLITTTTTTTTTTSSPSSQTPIFSAASLIYAESPSDASLTKLAGSLLDAAVFILFLTLLTFLLVVLYYYNFTSFISLYMRFSAFVLLIMTSSESLFDRRLDVISWFVLAINVSVIGAVGVFRGKGVPILVNQGCMVVLGVVVAVWFARLPEWTTWVMLVSMAVYDLVAVLAPVGPLRILVELAQRRGDGLPAFVYEARPTITVRDRRRGSGVGGLVAGVSDERSVEMTDMAVRNGDNVAEIEVVVDENEERGGRVGAGREDGEEMTPLVRESVRERRSSPRRDGGDNVEEMSPLVEMLGMQDEVREEDGESEGVFTRGTKLGLGDFVFYSVLVGRAAMYDLMTVYACYLAIICGLGCTLILLFVFRRALPALPISIALGVVFYFLTRLLMEPFVVGLSLNLMMF